MSSAETALKQIYLKLFIMLDLLSNEELEQVMGGSRAVTAEEYCETLSIIALNNELSNAAKSAAKLAWDKYC